MDAVKHYSNQLAECLARSAMNSGQISGVVKRFKESATEQNIEGLFKNFIECYANETETPEQVFRRAFDDMNKTSIDSNPLSRLSAYQSRHAKLKKKMCVEINGKEFNPDEKVTDNKTYSSEASIHGGRSVKLALEVVRH